MRPAAAVGLGGAVLAFCLVLAAGSPVLAEDAPPVIRALENPDNGSAREALRSHPEAGALAAAVLRDADTFEALSVTAREALVEIAADLDSNRINAGLRRVLRDGSQPDSVRRRAAASLGARGGVADVAALEGILAEYPAEAARALATIGGRSAETALRRHAGADAPPAVLAALARIGDDDALRTLATYLDEPAGAGDIQELMSWATGRDGPWDRAAADGHLRRRALVHQLALEDITAAQTVVQELAAVLASKTSSNLEPDLVAILGHPAWGADARCHAALVLGRGKAYGARDALLAACRNLEEGAVRLYAAEALAWVGDLSVAVPIADILVHDEDRDRIQARRTSTGEYFPVDPGLVRALFRLGCAGGVEPLLELIEGQYRTRMHRDTLRALREVTGGEAFGYEPDSSPGARAEASGRARAWWREARDGLGLAPREDDPGWETFRAHVAERIVGLGQFKFLYQLRAKKALVIVAEPALPQLVEALANEDLHIRMGAADVLTIARLRAAAAPLAERLAAEENPAARTKLLEGIAACGHPRPGKAPAPGLADAVRGVLADRALDVRIAAARTLGVVGDLGQDREALTRYAQHPVDALRTAAAGALLMLGDTDFLGVLCDELLCDDVARRAAAADVLDRGGVDMHGYDPDATPEAREAAVDAIRGVSPEER